MYAVIETKKKNTKDGREFSVVPEGWLKEDDDIVFRPKNGLVTLGLDENSTYDASWIPQAIVKIHYLGLTREQGQTMVDSLYEASGTESEDDRAKRLKKRQVEQPKNLPRKNIYSLSTSNTKSVKPPKKIQELLDTQIKKENSMTPPSQPSVISGSAISSHILMNTSNGRLQNRQECQIVESPSYLPTNQLILHQIQPHSQNYENISQQSQLILQQFQHPSNNFESVSQDQVVQQQHDNSQPNETVELDDQFFPIETEIDLDQFVALKRTVDMMSQDIQNMKESINSIRVNVDGTKASVSAQAEMIGQIHRYTSNIDKFMNEFINNRSTAIPEHKADEYRIAPESNENFADLEAMDPMKTSEDFHIFETSLENGEDQNRFVRYLASLYHLDGHQNGGTVFTMVIRLLTEPTLFLAYSWKGTKRNGVQNLCFSLKHKTFVQFIKRIVRLADRNKVADDVDQLFEKLLRFKKVEDNRENLRKSTGEQKAPKKPTPRNRIIKKEQKTESHLQEKNTAPSNISTEQNQQNKENNNDNNAI